MRFTYQHLILPIPPLNVILDTISITNAGDEGIYVNKATASMNNITIAGVNGDGIYGSEADISLTDGSVTNLGNDALSCTSCNLSIANSVFLEALVKVSLSMIARANFLVFLQRTMENREYIALEEIPFYILLLHWQ